MDAGNTEGLGNNEGAWHYMNNYHSLRRNPQHTCFLGGVVPAHFVDGNVGVLGVMQLPQDHTYDWKLWEWVQIGLTSQSDSPLSCISCFWIQYLRPLGSQAIFGSGAQTSLLLSSPRSSYGLVFPIADPLCVCCRGGVVLKLVFYCGIRHM